MAWAWRRILRLLLRTLDSTVLYSLYLHSGRRGEERGKELAIFFLLAHAIEPPHFADNETTDPGEQSVGIQRKVATTDYYNNLVTARILTA